MVSFRMFRVHINDDTKDIRVRGIQTHGLDAFEIAYAFDHLNSETFEGYREGTPEEHEIELQKLWKSFDPVEVI